MSKAEEMQKIMDELLALKQSPLYAERVANGYLPVIGEGSLDARIMFIGEAPGKKEAQTGRPFCGASGKMLDKLLAHVSITREDVYITNIVKDRPTDNRDPSLEEIALYAPFMTRQIDIIQPKVIATLGRFSMDFILRHCGLEKEISVISNIHGQVFKGEAGFGEVMIVPLYHPAVALYAGSRFDELKKDFEQLDGLI